MTAAVTRRDTLQATNKDDFLLGSGMFADNSISPVTLHSSIC